MAHNALLVAVGLKPDKNLTDKLLHEVIPDPGLLAASTTTDDIEKVDRNACNHPGLAGPITID